MSYNLDKIKSIPLVDFITQRYGWEFRGRGDERQAYFDGEEHSCFVSMSKNTYNWFAQGEGGSIIDFVMNREGINVKAAIQEIADFSGEVTIPIVKRSKPSPVKQVNIDTRIAESCTRNLCEASVGYWDSRGISRSTLEFFSVGKIFRYGKEWFTFPCYRGDRVAYLKLRLCPWEESKRGKAAFFPPGQSPLLMGANLISSAEEIAICEGESDMMMAHEHGTASVSGSNGCSVWKDEWSEIIASKTSKIILCYDQDDAGARGERLVANSFKNLDVTVDYYPFPKGYSGDLCSLLPTI